MEPNLKQWIVDNISVDYQKVLQLNGKQNPEDEPFQSLYAARKLLEQIMGRLEEFSEMLQKDLSVLQGTLLYQLGRNYVDCDEISSGESYLEKSYKMLSKIEDKVMSMICCILACHQLAVIWASRSEHEKALSQLLDAKTMYEAYKAPFYPLGEHELPSGLQDTLSEDKRKMQFESLHTHTLYYLAQTYGNLGKPALSANYCHTTLGRQMMSKRYDAIEWSLNCATLSQYYLNTDNYRQARHCLASSEHILLEYISKGEEKEDEMLEKIQQTKADIARCWIKYCIALLKYSQQLKEEGEAQNVLKAREDDFKPFVGVDVSAIESEVPYSPIDNFDAARNVFLFGQKCVESAKRFFTLEWHATDNISVIQDHSQLFKHLIFFEPALDRKCRMYKRRTDMLEDVLKELNPQHYLVLMRQLFFEVAVIYSEMADCKIIMVSNTEKPTPHSVLKINKLIGQSLKHFDNFLNSFHDNTGRPPVKFDKECLRSTLSARFWVARLHSKIIVVNPQAQLENTKKSLENYQWIVTYHKANPADVEACFAEELKMCQEMVDLLPHKLTKISLT